jgi:YgiT-type zinc finger domain-containing protein
MNCRVCGGDLVDRVTDLPFKIGDHAIVIIRGLPVLQCGACGEHVLRDPVMQQVERLLASADKAAELEIIRYAA